MAVNASGGTSVGSAVASQAFHGDALQDITALKAVTPEQRSDKQIRFVEDQLNDYHFDAQSAAGESLPDIVAPDAGTGRWLRVTPAGGVPGSHGSTHNPDGTDAPALAAPVSVTKAANAIGSASSFSRSDHKHDVDTAAAATIGTANSEGAASSLARSDHGHDHGAQTTATHHAAATGALNGFMSAADKAKLDAMDGFSTIYADQFENPVNADWAVNALAPAEADDDNNGLVVRAFDDTAEEGVGITVRPPAGVTSIQLRVVGRARTAPGVANTLGLKLYQRGIKDNAAIEAWSAGEALADLDIPTNENFQYDSETITLATLGMTAGEETQLELTRVAPGGGTDLTGDWLMLSLGIGWA